GPAGGGGGRRRRHGARPPAPIVPPPLGGGGRGGGWPRAHEPAAPPPPPPPRRKSGLPDLRIILRNPGKPGFRGGGSAGSLPAPRDAARASPYTQTHARQRPPAAPGLDHRRLRDRRRQVGLCGAAHG